ncbi:hypothetical protein [Pseudomonas kitaguniensis]|uniref:hypothetical protein n=1 Tax=Pseudomonas kitaguniensis TaxID=2607908 RepID=UPI003CFF3830
MSCPRTSDSDLTQFKWQPIPDSNRDRDDMVLCIFAEQRSISARLQSHNLDHKEYLLSLVDSAPTSTDCTGRQATFDAWRMRTVITEAAAKGYWGKLPKPGRAQGIAAHYEDSVCIAVLLDVEVSDEGGLTIHEALVVADVGPEQSPGRIRALLEGACLLGVAFVTSSNIGPTTSNLFTVDTQRSGYPMISVFPKKMTVHLTSSVENLDADQSTMGSQINQLSYMSVVRALCNAIFNATKHRTCQLLLRSQLLEKTEES